MTAIYQRIKTLSPALKAGAKFLAKVKVRYQKTDIDVDELNRIFTPLSFEDRIKKLYEYFPESEVLYTSSFGARSVFMLHLLHKIRPSQKVHFINTTYHFPETLAYKEELTERFKLQVEEVLPETKENALTREEQWWKDHPRMCCAINKVAPLEPIKAKHSVWISGLMAYQTPFRAGLRVFEKQGDIIKFHPIVDIDEGEFLYHMSYHKLPQHPLLAEGYGSIGCLHCTAKGEGREGRWQGKEKTECGLHPGYFAKRAQELGG